MWGYWIKRLLKVRSIINICNSAIKLVKNREKDNSLGISWIHCEVLGFHSLHIKKWQGHLTRMCVITNITVWWINTLQDHSSLFTQPNKTKKDIFETWSINEQITDLLRPSSLLLSSSQNLSIHPYT